MSTTPSTRQPVMVAAEGENMNMGPPGKAIARPRQDISSNRAVLGELTANSKLDKPPQRTGSPLKRSSNVFDNEAKGFSYLKRRRLSHNQALTRRITPLSPPPSSREERHHPQQQQSKRVSPNEHDSLSEGDSGRESQNSNKTRGSFSSLINYDPSSQQHQGHSQHASSRQMSIKTAAELLRLRLRIALYKIQTNQINVPFSRLQLHVKPRPQQQQPPPSPDALPMAPPPLRHNTERHTHNTTDTQSQPQPPLLSTPNMYSNRFMPYHAPSSSPPLIHDPLPRIAREAQARMAAASATAVDRDSLDSEATELADDQDDHGIAESPLHRRHSMLPTNT